MLGFLPPVLASSSGDPNLGLLDVINGLRAIQYYAPLVGGDSQKVTVGGQSSGAGMIRCTWLTVLGLSLLEALLGTPEAVGLFRAAILQSDPMVGLF